MTRVIEVTVQVEVAFTPTTEVVGEDADGTRGQTVQVWTAGKAECLERVPVEVATWAEARAVEIFKDRYGI